MALRVVALRLANIIEEVATPHHPTGLALGE